MYGTDAGVPGGYLDPVDLDDQEELVVEQLQ